MKQRVNWLKPQEVADALGVTKRTVYAWIAEGKIRYKTIGKTYRLPDTVLMDDVE